jgi:hypothetical protein
MNMKTAEEAALDYASGEPRWPPSMHVRAHTWAYCKKSDKRVSKAFRQRAASVAFRLRAATSEPAQP